MCFMMFIGLQGYGYHWSIAIADWSAKEASRATWGKISYYEISFLWSPKSCWKSPRGWGDVEDFYPLQYSYLFIAATLFLQFQRKLQLQIEEQGRYLQMMWEKKRGIEREDSKATSSAVNDDTSPCAIQSASGNEKTGAPDQNSPRTVVNPSNLTHDGSSSASGKHKMQETTTVDEEEGPPTGPKSDWLGWAAASDSRSWTVDNAFPASVGDGN